MRLCSSRSRRHNPVLAARCPSSPGCPSRGRVQDFRHSSEEPSRYAQTFVRKNTCRSSACDRVQHLVRLPSPELAFLFLVLSGRRRHFLLRNRGHTNACGLSALSAELSPGRCDATVRARLCDRHCHLPFACCLGHRPNGRTAVSSSAPDLGDCSRPPTSLMDRSVASPASRGRLLACEQAEGPPSASEEAGLLCLRYCAWEWSQRAKHMHLSTPLVADWGGQSLPPGHRMAPALRSASRGRESV